MCLFGHVEEFVPRVNEEGMYNASPASNLNESIPVSCRKEDRLLSFFFLIKVLEMLSLKQILQPSGPPLCGGGIREVDSACDVALPPEQHSGQGFAGLSVLEFKLYGYLV